MQGFPEKMCLGFRGSWGDEVEHDNAWRQGLGWQVLERVLGLSSSMRQRCSFRHGWGQFRKGSPVAYVPPTGLTPT